MIVSILNSPGLGSFTAYPGTWNSLYNHALALKKTDKYSLTFMSGQIAVYCLHLNSAHLFIRSERYLEYQLKWWEREHQLARLQPQLLLKGAKRKLNWTKLAPGQWQTNTRVRRVSVWLHFTVVFATVKTEEVMLLWKRFQELGPNKDGHVHRSVFADNPVYTSDFCRQVIKSSFSKWLCKGTDLANNWCAALANTSGCTG